MSDLTFIPGLSGEEIIIDLTAAFAEKLRSDCNLRKIDQYSGGYKASIPAIHVECFGLDQATVDYSLEVDNTTLGQEGNLVDFTFPDTVIDTEVEVPVEPDLSLVRERGQQPTPDFEAKPEITADGPVMPSKRKYSRRLKALAVAQGGAAEPLNE
jgi:hypothetical protein